VVGPLGAIAPKTLQDMGFANVSYAVLPALPHPF